MDSFEPDVFTPFKSDLAPSPTLPISFVVVRFSDEYYTNFARSEAAACPINEIVVVDNTSNLFFDNLTSAMAYGIAKAKNRIIAVVHEDVLLPNGWQNKFEKSLFQLDQFDPLWMLLGSVGWTEAGEIVGHWRDPRNYLNSFASLNACYAPVASVDEQILVMNKDRLPPLDLDLPGIHHLGRDIPRALMAQHIYAIDAPTIHKYADSVGQIVSSAHLSEKIRDRDSLTYAADRAICNQYIKHKWSDLEVKDYFQEDFSLPFNLPEKLSQLESPIILLGRGGGGTRLLGKLAVELGIFLGANLNDSYDTIDMVLPIYQGIVAKYRAKAAWQKESIVPRIRAAAARMIAEIPSDQMWGFKLPEALLLLPELSEAFPKARYIHMVRDPLATCVRRSHMTARLDNHIGRIAVPLAYDWLGRQRSSILRDEPQVLMAVTTLHQLSLANGFLSQFGDQQKFSFHFEDLFSQAQEIATRLLHWLGREGKVKAIDLGLDESRVAARLDEIAPSVMVKLCDLLSFVRSSHGYEDFWPEHMPAALPGTRKLIVVLGMHRSGTSALAGLLSAHGVDFGNQLMAPTHENEKGFFEDQRLVAFNDALLAHLGEDWLSASSIGTGTFNLPRFKPYLYHATLLLRELLKDNAVFGIKDPRMCRLLAFWQQVFDYLGVQAIYTVALRNPYDTALSLARRNNFDTDKSIGIWLRYNLDVLSFEAIRKQPFVVDYDELVADTANQFDRIRSYLDTNGVELQSYDSGFIDESLNHGRDGDLEFPIANAKRHLSMSLYQLVKRMGRSSPSAELWHQIDDLSLSLDSTVREIEITEDADRLLALNQAVDLLKNQAALLADSQAVGRLTKCDLIDAKFDLASARSENKELLENKETLGAELDKIRRAFTEKTEERLAYESAVCSSLSWKITAPLRFGADKLASFRRTAARADELGQQMGYGRFLGFVAKVLATEGLRGFRHRAVTMSVNAENKTTYQQWIEDFDTVTPSNRKRMSEIGGRFSHKPLISIVMPTYNTPEGLLQQAIDSILAQIYPNWELCIADDCSSNQEVRDIVLDYARRDKRIKYVFLQDNGHISKASNAALKLAEGEYIALMDHDDLLPQHALFWVVYAINEKPEGRLFYSDEDKVDLSGVRHDPYFKCDWNPDLFMSHNMISHFGVYYRPIIEEIGGFREGYEGSQDYDLAHRFIEKIGFHQVIHIPRVLYHWRIMPGSTALSADEKPYAMIAGERAINDHLRRTGRNANCTLLGWGYRVQYALTNEPKVSIIIPTRDAVDILRVIVSGIMEHTDYKNFELIIVDNGSTESETLSYFEHLRDADNVLILRDDGEFNFSRLNNLAARHASGEVLALVNNDIEIQAPDWLTEMVSQAMRPEVGAVGCRLIYPDKTLQHAGIILGLGGLAAYSHRGIPADSPGYFGRAMLLQMMSAVTAACLVVRREVYEQVNGLDEQHLAVAYNDVDFCLRVREAGYLNVFTPYAELIHHESKTRGPEDTPEKQERARKEYAYMRSRWGEILDRDAAYNPNLTLDREDFSLAMQPRVPHVL